MEHLTTGFSVAAIGLLVVFVGLVIIIAFIKLLAILVGGSGRKPREPKRETAPVAVAPVAVPEPATPAPSGIPGDVLAAITAAISAVWEGETGFTVRRVRRVSNAPAWNRAGREEQTYSRL